MIETTHSEFLKLKTVYLKPVKNAFVSNNLINEQWESLNYLAPPDFDAALDEYLNFQEILQKCDVALKFFKEDPKVQMDSIYCRDASIATDYGMILCEMGKSGRLNEPSSHARTYKDNNEKILGRISAPGTLEGGDVAWLDTKTLAVGHSYRTNEEGIEQLRSLLEPRGIEIIVAELPHYKGKNDVFHLMSIISPIDKDLAVVYSPLMPIKFRNELLNRGMDLIEVPEEEFDSMGCNVLAVAPRKCLMVEGNPITKQQLTSKGCEVITYKGEEISVKGGGGPTCLTRPQMRSYK